MSRMNNSNKKSTQKRALTNMESAFINQFVKSANVPTPRLKKGSQKRPLNRGPKRPYDVNPVQARSKKSPTGAAYNDGFDAVSPPDRLDQRLEDFDELIGTVTGQIGFTILSYVMNPGNSTTFPRLSKIAQLFERYRFEKLEFYFQHDVSQYASQGQTGLVLLSALYDAASSPPTTKTQVEATKPRVICMPNQNSLLCCARNRLHPQGVPLYVRPGNLPGGADIKTYDAGNMFLTVQGMVGSGEVGELHVRGKVMLMDEILDSSALQTPANNQVSQATGSAETATTATPYVLLFATPGVNGVNWVITNGSIVPPAGNYIFTAHVRRTFTGLATQVTTFLYKNVTALVLASTVFTSGTLTQVTQDPSSFVSCNGTDALTVSVDDTFSTGTDTLVSLVMLVAV
jgi:hypothetical protein